MILNKSNTIPYITQVKEFMQTFGQPVIDSPSIPSKDRCDLRVSLIAEELEELKVAIKDNDLVEIADALCDLQYVLSGAIIEFGMKDKFDDMFAEVQRSNMSKACETVEDAEKTIEYYLKERGDESYYKEVDGKFLVYRKTDNKVLKSVNYSAADLRKFL